jgi:hypothetical protein
MLQIDRCRIQSFFFQAFLFLFYSTYFSSFIKICIITQQRSASERASKLVLRTTEGRKFIACMRTHDILGIALRWCWRLCLVGMEFKRDKVVFCEGGLRAFSYSGDWGETGEMRGF